MKFHCYSSSTTWSTVLFSFSRLPPTGSFIFRFTRALPFIPTTRSRIRKASAVLPALPIILPMSSGCTVRVSKTPIWSIVRVVSTDSGWSASAFTAYSRNAWSGSMLARRSRFCGGGFTNWILFFSFNNRSYYFLFFNRRFSREHVYLLALYEPFINQEVVD